jgi:glycosyltransferase involved in cell wall biosynthesis
MPRVSVVIAVLDGEAFLREALESVFAQDYPEFEVILVDDGSTDGSAAIAQSFPLRYLHQKTAGPSAARNTALRVATGEYVATVDADDIVPAHKLSSQIAYLEQHPEIGCVLGRHEWILEDGVEAPPLDRDPLFGELGGIQLVTAVYRRRVLADLGGYDESYAYAEDRDLFVRMRQSGLDYAVIPDVVLYKRLHGANLTMNQPDNHPLLRSLKEKLDRDRGAGVDG